MNDGRVRLCLLVMLMLGAGLLWLALPTPASADTYTVTTTNDSGSGSLRQAIIAANAHVGPDDITFAIPIAQCTSAGGVCTISPTSALPTITDRVRLIGRTQPGTGSTPLIEVNGSSAGDSVNGLTISAGNSYVAGFAINRFRGNGIALTTVGGNIIYGNHIGTDPSGTIARGNLLAGISISQSPGNTIGPSGNLTDTLNLFHNVISGNTIGINIGPGSDGTALVGNYIGTDINGTGALGNTANGVTIAGSSSTAIGVAALVVYPPGARPNVIAFNGGTGVAVLNGSTTNNAITGNAIFQNGALGIDIGESGVTPNDPLDEDSGANGLQNSPTLTSARLVGGRTLITGVLSSAPNAPYSVNLYVSPSCDPSGYGEGQDELGAALLVTTDGQGRAPFSLDVPAQPAGRSVTSTASTVIGDIGFNGLPPLGATSEFSACRSVTTPGITVARTGPRRTAERGDAATLTVTLRDQPLADVTIPLSSSNTHEGIVSPTSLVFTPANWNVPQTATVTGVDDMVDDGDQEYMLQVGPASSADGAYQGLDPDDPTLTNLDDDGTPVLTIADLSITEGNAGTTSATFTISLEPASTQTVTVLAQTADDSAKAGSDYTTTGPITLTLAPGTTTQTFTVPVMGDTVVEPDERFFVDLSDAVNATILDGQGSGTIRNDDTQTVPAPTLTPTLSIADVSVIEGSAGTTPATFTVSLAPASAQAVTVRYATSDDTATAPGDYVPTSGTLTFGPGETSKAVAVAVVGDAAVESDERFVVTLSGPTNGTLGRGQASGTIRNDDVQQAAAQPCAPRPAPRIESRQVGPGRLEVTVTAQTTPLLPSNALQRMDFGAADNALVEIFGAAPGAPGGPSAAPGGPVGTPGGFSLTPPAGTASTTFVVQRQQPGAFKVSLVIADGCLGPAGPFATFVGGGAGVK